MATSPVQMVMCEAGLLPFKSTLLPVIPYSLLAWKEKEQLQNMLGALGDHQLHETIESSGQYTVTELHFHQQNHMTSSSGGSTAATPAAAAAATVCKSAGTVAVTLCKRSLLHAFVDVMLLANCPSSCEQDFVQYSDTVFHGQCLNFI